MPQYWGDTRHFFLLILYNFKNIGWGGGGGGANVSPAPTPYSAVPVSRELLLVNTEVRSFRNACARRDKMKYSWHLTKER